MVTRETNEIWKERKDDYLYITGTQPSRIVVNYSEKYCACLSRTICLLIRTGIEEVTSKK
jgi:hypothetical protein